MRRVSCLVLLRAASDACGGIGSNASQSQSALPLARLRELATKTTSNRRRLFSSTIPSNNVDVDLDKGQNDDDNLHRPLRLLLFATLCGAAAAVLPQTLSPSPQAAVALLGAESAALRRSGAERARRLVGGGESSGGGASSKGAELLASVPGAASVLLDAAFREEEEEKEGGGDNKAARAAALSAAVAWARHAAGRTALLEAGAVDRASAAVASAAAAAAEAEGGEGREDAKHLIWLLREVDE